MSLKTEWRPIETAPKDGSWVLAINARTNRGHQHVVHYSTRHSESFPWVTDSGPMSWVDGLTHWMPLPAPPSSSLILEREEAGGETADSSHLAVPTNGPENLSEAAGVERCQTSCPCFAAHGECNCPRGANSRPLGWVRLDDVYDLTTHPDGAKDPMRAPVYLHPRDGATG